MDDKELLKGIRQGREEAFKMLYERHYGVLCSVAQNYVGDSFMAESLVGDVIVRLWSDRQRVQIDRSLRMYLVRSVRNACLDYIKSQYHQREFAASEYIERSLHELYVGKSLPGSLLEKELENKIQEAVKAIPLESRRVFMMSRFHDMFYTETARLESSRRIPRSFWNSRKHIPERLLIRHFPTLPVPPLSVM